MSKAWINYEDDIDRHFDSHSSHPPSASGSSTPQEMQRMLPSDSQQSTLSDPPILPSEAHYRPNQTRSLSASSPMPSLPSDSKHDPQPSSHKPRRSLSSASFISSPLNPTSPLTPPFARPRPASRGSMHVSRIASEESRVLSGLISPLSPQSTGSRASMILYRLAADPPPSASPNDPLMPPSFSRSSNRASFMSSSGDSIISLSSDSKYPSGLMGATERGLVPYAYDPSVDEMEPADDEDALHDPSSKQKYPLGLKEKGVAWRGLTNYSMLIFLITGLLCLFVVYPVVSFFRNNGRNAAIVGNIRINSSGQAVDESIPVDRRSLGTQVPFRFWDVPLAIDPSTPSSEKLRIEADVQYQLVFSDEFGVEGRTFYPGDDAFWETSPGAQISTHNGHLVSVPSGSSEDATTWDAGGSLRSLRPFCLGGSGAGEGGGAIVEVGLVMPGEGESTRVWTLAIPPDAEAAILPGQTRSPPRPAVLNLRIPADPSIHIDHVRIYQHKGDTPHQPGCGVLGFGSSFSRGKGTGKDAHTNIYLDPYNDPGIYTWRRKNTLSDSDTP